MFEIKFRKVVKFDIINLVLKDRNLTGFYHKIPILILLYKIKPVRFDTIL